MSDEKAKELEARIEAIENWIDTWEGLGQKPFDSGWKQYRENFNCGS